MADVMSSFCTRPESDQIFIRRSNQALDTITKHLNPENTLEAASKSSDLDVLLFALERVAKEVFLDDPMAEARIRGLKATRKLMKLIGPMISTTEASETLGISKTAVTKKVKLGKLIGLRQNGSLKYPVWQFKDGEVLKGLGEVIEELDDDSQWVRVRFFSTPNSMLGNICPLEKLQDGDLDDVLRAARAYGNQGAI